MLQILTGAIQSGKTRWLERYIAAREAEGMVCCGLLSPGVWVEHRDAGAGVRYEKTGIEAVLLPGGRRLPFAQRRDLALGAGIMGDAGQSEQAGLGWAIDDAAIAAVNRHFDELAEQVQGAASKGGEVQRLLIVDELGRLELERGGGLTSAMRLLELGPAAGFSHALAVVRDSLAPLAISRLKPSWPNLELLEPKR